MGAVGVRVELNEGLSQCISVVFSDIYSIETCVASSGKRKMYRSGGRYEQHDCGLPVVVHGAELCHTINSSLRLLDLLLVLKGACRRSFYAALRPTSV